MRIEYKEKMGEYKEFSCPSSEIGKLVSEPKSKKGKINWENSTGFSIEVSETSNNDFNDYIEDCKGKGFTVDYESVVNEYVDFMKKYKASGNSATMLGDYMKILNKYIDMADKVSLLMKILSII